MKIILSFIISLIILIQPAALTVNSEEITTVSSLRLSSSSVVDCDKNISTDVTIQLDFTGNITDITTLENNKNAFYLLDKDGNSVPIKVVFPDTQMDGAYKMQVFISPAKELANNTTYTLIIDDSLMTKKGVYLDKNYRIGFTTSSENVPKTTNEALEYLKENILEYDVHNTYSKDISAADSSEPMTTNPSENDGMNTNFTAPIAAITVIILVVAVTLLGRNKKN